MLSEDTSIHSAYLLVRFPETSVTKDSFTHTSVLGRPIGVATDQTSVLFTSHNLCPATVTVPALTLSSNNPNLGGEVMSGFVFPLAAIVCFDCRQYVHVCEVTFMCLNHSKQ